MAAKASIGFLPRAERVGKWREAPKGSFNKLGLHLSNDMDRYRDKHPFGPAGQFPTRSARGRKSMFAFALTAVIPSKRPARNAQARETGPIPRFWWSAKKRF
jgi:hypothetical protein